MSELPVVLKYNKALGLVFLILGGVNILLWLWLVLLGSWSPVIITGVMVWIVGLGYLRSPYFAVDVDAVVLYNLLGMKVRVYPLQTFQELEVEGHRLYVNSGGKRQRIKVTKWMVDAQDWQRLVQACGASQGHESVEDEER